MPRAFVHEALVPLHGDDPRRILPAVLQQQGVIDELVDWGGSERANDAAHGRSILRFQVGRSGRRGQFHQTPHGLRQHGLQVLQQCGERRHPREARQVGAWARRVWRPPAPRSSRSAPHAARRSSRRPDGPRATVAMPGSRSSPTRHQTPDDQDDDETQQDAQQMRQRRPQALWGSQLRHPGRQRGRPR